MTYTLTCPNGKQINMTTHILQQMKGELTRQEVEDLILAYKILNTD